MNKLTDRDFEDLRKQIAAKSDAWLVESLREIPHRKRMELEKDTFVLIGLLARRAAKRIEELTAERHCQVEEFIGWLSGDIPELHKVEVPRLADSWDRFKAAKAQEIKRDAG